jgi:hypothetical protein
MESIASKHGHEIIRTFLNWIVEPLPVIRPETGFEEIGAQAALRNVTFPRTGLLAHFVPDFATSFSFYRSSFSFPPSIPTVDPSYLASPPPQSIA